MTVATDISDKARGLPTLDDRRRLGSGQDLSSRSAGDTSELKSKPSSTNSPYVP